MKQIKYISVLFIIAALVFTGCSNNVSAPQKNLKNDDGQVKGITISGGININANALPSQLQNVSSSRMATAGSEGSFFINCPDSTVEAKNLTTGYTMTGGIYEVDTSKYAYSITLPGSGEWLIKVNAKAGEASYYGEAEVDIKYSNGPFGSGLVMQSSEPPSIVLYPLFKEGETGTINLTVKNQMPTPYSTNPYTVKMIWQNDIPETIKSQLDHDENDDIYYKTVTMQSTLNSESEAFNITNVPAGAYKVEIQFCNSNGKVLYSCNQWIHVFGNMTTNSWYGTGSQYISDSNKTWLALTELAVLEYESLQETVYPDVALSCTYNTAKQLKIQKIQNNDYQSNNSTFITPGSSFEFSGNQLTVEQNLKNVFCYYGNDTMYIAGHAKDNNSNHYEVVYKVTGDSNTATPYCFSKAEISDTNYSEEFSIEDLYVAPDGNVVYGITQGKYGAGTYFPKLFAYKPDEAGTKTKFFEGSIRTHQKLSSFIIYNGCLYIPDFYDGKLTITCYLLDYYKLEEIFSKSKTITNLNISHPVQITDMVCVEDNIYILFNDNYTSEGGLNSRGGVIKYDLFTQSCSDYSGFVTQDLYSSIGTIDCKCSGKYDLVTPVYGSLEDLYNDKIYTLPISLSNYSPQNSESEFYGPQKILSYDNQYIYIADSGYKFILPDGENEFCFEPVNRVVKFDISSMSIDAISAVLEDENFIYPIETIFIYGTEGYSGDDTEVFDEDSYTYTVKHPYIPKKN